MSINVQNISVVMMNNLINNTFNTSWFLHATAGDLLLDGSTLHSSKTLIVTAALSDARVNNHNLYLLIICLSHFSKIFVFIFFFR